jgi:hypothetical protein
MDYQPTTNNEDEFAKALNNLSGDAAGNDFFADNNDASYLNQTDGTQPAAETPAPAFEAPAEEPVAAAEPVAPAAAPEPTPAFTPAANVGGGDFGSLKTSVLTDLRPVIEKVDISADEKYHLLSTLFNANHDQSLIEPAYVAARQIGDDTKRAEALLEIVHDIDSVN